MEKETEEIRLWISRYNTEKMKKRYLKHLTSYCEFHGKTPSELLQIKKDDKDSTAEKMLDMFVLEWDKPESIKQNAVSAVRSFYKANYLDLASGAGSGVKYRRIGPYRNPTTDQLREMCLGAHIRDIAIVNVFSSGGFRIGTLVQLTWGHVSEIEEWNGTDPIHVGVLSEELKGAGFGAYEGVEQHAFLTPHTTRILIRYRAWREGRGEVVTPKSPLFVTLTGKKKRLGERMIRFALERMCQGKGFYFSPHDLRRYTQTQLEVPRIQPNWIRKMLGKKVPMAEAPYSLPKIEQMREAYRDAIPHVTLAPPQAIFDEVELARRDARNAVKTFYRLRGEKPPKDVLLDLDDMLKKFKTKERVEGATDKWFNLQKKIKGGLPELMYVSKLVNEDELANYLDRGFDIEGVLPSGKIAIKRRR